MALITNVNARTWAWPPEPTSMRDEPKDRSRRTEPRKGVDKILGNRGEAATEEYSRDNRETKEAPSDQPLDRKTRRMTEQKTHKENTAMR